MTPDKPANSATIILINGLPGTGKTTLARKLSEDLRIPLISKDEVKEFIADRLGLPSPGQDNEALTKAIGSSIFDLLYGLGSGLAGAGYNLMIESPFFADYAQPRFKQIRDELNIQIIEVYCYVDEATRLRRIVHRKESGQRHPIHLDYIAAQNGDPTTLQQIYRPLGLGKVYKIDTTEFNEVNYKKLMQDVTEDLKRKD